MARFNCKCGEVLSNSMAPNEIELRVYTDKEWDEIMAVDTINTWEIPMPQKDIWKCPTCQRLYVFDKGSDKASAVYKLEENT